jgi:hypothetical protein
MQIPEGHEKILIFEFSGSWTWEEFYVVRREADALLDTLDYVVDLILDFRQGPDLPSSAFTHLRTNIAHKHLRQGIIVVLGVNTNLKAISDTLVKIYPRLNYLIPRMARTLEEAISFCTAAERQRRFIGSQRSAS